MLLAMRMASSKSLARMTASTGPKISSRAMVCRFFDAGEHRGLDKVPVGQRAFGKPAPAAQRLARFLARDFDVAEHGIHLRLVYAGADVDAGLHAVADLQFARALHHRGHETIVDGVFHDGAAGRGAFLPGGEERRVDHVFHGGVEIRVGQYDGRVLAAHFELDAQPPFGCLRVQPRRRSRTTR